MSNPFDVNSDERPFGSTGNTQFLVSLYLIIMAFFIVLSSLGDRKSPESGAKLGDFKSSFGKPSSEEQNGNIPAGTSVTAEGAPEGTVFDHAYQPFINRLEERFALDEGSLALNDNHLRVRLPYSSLFPDQQISLSSDTQALVRSVVEMLNRVDSISGIEVRLAALRVLLPPADNGTSLVAQQTRRIARRQGATLARAFEAAIGANKGVALGVGFQNDRSPELILQIKIDVARHVAQKGLGR